MDEIGILKNTLRQLEENVANQNNVINSFSIKLNTLKFTCFYLFIPYIISTILYFISKLSKSNQKPIKQTNPQKKLKEID